MWIMAAWVALKVWLLRIYTRDRTFAPSKLNRSHLMFDRFSEPLHVIRQGVTSWRALDVIYNFRPGVVHEGLFVTVVTNYWLGMVNAQAVRNRLQLVKSLLRDAIKIYAASQDEVRVLSFASGSAQGLIEVLAELESVTRSRIRVTAIDYDGEALEHGKRLARKYGVERCFTWERGSILRCPFDEYSPHIVEMLGFLDYLDDSRAVQLLTRVNCGTVTGGTVFVCNIAPNPEMFFMRWVVGWEMIYMTQAELLNVVLSAGYARHRVAVHTEPHLVHNVIAAQS